MNKKPETNQKGVETLTLIVDAGLASIGFPPVASFFPAIGKLVSTLQEESLLENLAAFFSNANKAEPNEREKFFNELGKDKDEFIRKIILSIELMHDKKKSLMIGNLFTNTVKGSMSKSDFVRLCFVIERIYIEDLLRFKDIFEQEIYIKNGVKERSPELDNPHLTDLLSNGLLDKGIVTYSPNQILKITQLGIQYLKCAF